MRRIAGQPREIQQLIIPDLYPDMQRRFPQGWLNNQQWQQLRQQRRLQQQQASNTTALNLQGNEIILISDDDTDVINPDTIHILQSNHR